MEKLFREKKTSPLLKTPEKDFQYPRTGGTGENTPFAVESRKKERDNGHNNLHRVTISFF